MSIHERQEDLKSRILLLAEKKRLAFAIWCAERLYPNYIAFSSRVGWGDSRVVREGLDLAWDALSGKPSPPDTLEGVIRDCEAQVPSSEDFECILTTPAQDAVFAICSVLDYLQGNDVEAVLRPSSYAIDSVDLYVQESEGLEAGDPGRESRIEEHPLMSAELEAQSGLLQQIGTEDDVIHLVASTRGTTAGNLGL